MQREITPLEETLQALQERCKFFQSRQISAENILLSGSMYSVRSLSEIRPQLCAFGINETPLHINLADIYLGQRASDQQTKFLLPPVSEGEDSITEQDTFEPSFKWVASTIVDSSFLTTDHIEPKKVQRGKIPSEWKGVTQLVLFNVEKRIYVRQDMAEIEDYLKGRFQKFPWIRLKRSKEIFYKGKPSVLLRFVDQISSAFAYFNLATSTQKSTLGAGCEVLRVTQDKIRQSITNDVTLVFRKLPGSMTKETFLGLFKKGQGPVWVQELVEIEGFKYTICKVTHMQDAFAMVSAFLAKNIKEAKVNYHPKSAKTWRQNEPNYFDNI